MEEPLKELLGIPEPVSIALTITLGRPEGRHGPLRRRPVADLVFEGRWEQPALWVHDPSGSRFSRSGPPTAARFRNRRSS